MRSYQRTNNDEEAPALHMSLDEKSIFQNMNPSKRRWLLLGAISLPLWTFFILMGVLWTNRSAPIVLPQSELMRQMNTDMVTPETTLETNVEQKVETSKTALDTTLETTLETTPETLDTALETNTPEPFVFPERIRLVLDFYVNTPKGKVRGYNIGYMDWSTNANQPRMRWDQIYDNGEINDMLPLIYDGVAGPNANGDYKYWSMDRYGSFRCNEFPFPENYPRDILGKEGKYLGEKEVDGKMTNVWTYKFMGVSVVIYVDATDNTKLIKETISLTKNQREDEIMQVYDNIRITPIESEFDDSMFKITPRKC